MNNNEIQKLPDEILEHEVVEICKRYKIDPENAREILLRSFADQPMLLQKIMDRYSHEDVTRYREYKEIIKNARKQVYYYLRQYQRDKKGKVELDNQLELLIQNSADSSQISQVVTDLLLTHVSTEERSPCYQDFYRYLFDLIESPKSIIDIGCGLHPLSYPFHAQSNTVTYLAIDNAPEVIHTLSIFAPYAKPTNLIPVCSAINKITWAEYLIDGNKSFELAFMLKLIPVIYRQEREVLTQLANVPADMILVTASSEALTRKQNISNREDSVLREFMKIANRKIVSNFNIGNEFGYLLQ